MSSPRSINSPQYSSSLDDCNVFVKYLPSDLSEEQFYELFKEFGPIVSSKIMIDQNTGKSLGFGFVRFESSDASMKAINAMNGNQIQNKRLLCKLANQSQNSSDHMNLLLKNQIPSNNLFIKPLLPNTKEEDLRKLFEPFGKIHTCKVMIDHKTKKSKQIGFVKFETKEEAKRAMEKMNNYKIEDNAIPLVVKYEDSKEQKAARKTIKHQGNKYENNRNIPNSGVPPMFMYQSPPMVIMGANGFSYPPYPGYDIPVPFSPPSYPYPIPHNINPESFSGGSPIYPYSWNPDFQLSPYGPGTPNPNSYVFDDSDEMNEEISKKNEEEIETLLLDNSDNSNKKKDTKYKSNQITEENYGNNNVEKQEVISKTRPITIKQRTRN
jgi:RNA recognition motif-containing protein